MPGEEAEAEDDQHRNEFADAATAATVMSVTATALVVAAAATRFFVRFGVRAAVPGVLLVHVILLCG
jgi:hypothetical protein